ncbi:photosystem reaction center subunit H [Paraburkholderia monticola]|uniref:Photosystem reaction center subunit H n=1 Tax=Paraburkholderia monticola TaxID=1399968 RepID=A0A149Q1H6_9BURK|nr:PRC-barrel domain-containing protein [Paraburkholderia monticola]KXU91165.1 photosystem reaction center subunit H [Paraburkholderia monticola]
MLRSIRSLHGCVVRAFDGDIGSVNQVYFDDESWGVRYLVVETGNWLSDRQVLISPYSVEHAGAVSNPVQAVHAVHVSLTRQQVKDSPNIDAHKPVSRQNEIEYLRYYSYPTYWGGPNLWGMGAYPAFDPTGPTSDEESELPAPPILHVSRSRTDVHLRSTEAIKGYHLQTADGSLGHVSDFIYDDEAWVIRYLVVDTRNWWPGGKEILIATYWLDEVDWFASTVSTSLTREIIRQSPAYDDSVPLHRSYEVALHQFYGKHGYWSKADLYGQAP